MENEIFELNGKKYVKTEYCNKIDFLFISESDNKLALYHVKDGKIYFIEKEENSVFTKYTRNYNSDLFNWRDRTCVIAFEDFYLGEI